MPPIASFTGAYRWLSNFYPAVVVLDGMTYPTVEHAFQAAKTLNTLERAVIRRAERPGLAKARGKTVTLRDHWDDLRLAVMEGLLRQKFKQGSSLAVKLMATGAARIEEGNTWGDQFWGTCGGVGENHLGKLLMKIRAYLEADAVQRAAHAVGKETANGLG